MSLDTIGIIYGTDKSSLRHNYLAQYEKLLGHLRDRAITLIEVGIHNGASLSVWQAYFTKAMVVGIEIDPQGKRFAGDRIKVEIGSQDDGEFLAEVTRKYFPDVVIDDGSHRPDHQIFSFEHLFPALAPAGCYIVEDVSVARSERYGGISATSYFGRLQEGLMSRWTCGGLDAVPPWVRTEVSRVDVFRGAVAVWKSEAINFSSNVNWLEELVRRSEKPESWLYLSEYLDRRAGLLDRALDAARRGAQLEPWNAWFQVRIGEILKKMGDREGAIAAARSAAALERQWHPDQPNPFFEQFLNRILGSA